MKEEILKITERSARVLYRRGLMHFDGEMQQYLISRCAIGKIAEIYGNEELKQASAEDFLNAWFRGRKAETKGVVSLYDFDKNILEKSPKSYLIFIFYGIGMRYGDTRMKKFSEELKKLILKRNGENTVQIKEIAAYDDTGKNSFFKDGIITDAVQVVLRAYMPYGSASRKFADAIQKMCEKTNPDRLILIGYSGGGVVASGVNKELLKRGAKAADYIIRIGSPELKMSNEDAKNTVNIIIPGDPVPLVEFIKDESEVLNTRFLTDIKYGTVNPIEIHGLYFSENADSSGKTNYQKTALSVSDYIS